MCILQHLGYISKLGLNHLPICFQDGADINSRSDWNGTALYYAACNGHDQLVEFFLEKGAEADPKDNKGCKTKFIFSQKIQ